MRSRILAVLALSAAVVVPAAFAQQGDQAGVPQPAAVSDQASQIEVTGAIVTLTADRIDVRVASVTAPPSANVGSTVMVGNTTAFTVDSATELPRGLKAGDRVDLWFKNDNGSLLATRVAIATSTDQPAGGNESASTLQSSNTSASSSSEQSTTSSSTSTVEPSASTAEPGNSTAAPNGARRENLPKTGSPLPLIGLLGLAALASMLVLRFVVRA